MFEGKSQWTSDSNYIFSIRLEFLDRIFKSRTFLDAAQRLSSEGNPNITYYISGPSVPTKQQLERFAEARSGFNNLRNEYEAAQHGRRNIQRSQSKLTEALRHIPQGIPGGEDKWGDEYVYIVKAEVLPEANKDTLQRLQKWWADHKETYGEIFQPIIKDGKIEFYMWPYDVHNWLVDGFDINPDDPSSATGRPWGPLIDLGDGARIERISIEPSYGWS